MRHQFHLLALLPIFGCYSATAVAIDVQRPEVRAFIDMMAHEHAFNRSRLRALLRKAESKPAIIDAMDKPAERVLPWCEYRERFLTEQRIDKGVAFSRQHAKEFNRVRQSGVSPDIVLGILGVETMYGEITGNYRVLDALVTLSFDYPPRADFFRNELAQFLLLTREESVNARKALGSYAGAIGAPQFMPSSYRRIAVDGDGDKHRNLWSSWPDILLSVANYFKVNGWRDGEPVLVSATLAAADLPKFDIAKLRLNETVASLRAKGAHFETDQPDDAPAMLIVTDGCDGNEYRVGFNNFFVISRYNPRIKYSLAVYELSEAIARARADAAR